MLFTIYAEEKIVEPENEGLTCLENKKLELC